MNVEVNVWAVILSAAASMVIGSLWYGKPLFMTQWQKLTNMTPKKGKELQNAMVVGMTVALVSSLLMAYVLAHAAYIAHGFYGNSFLTDSLKTAFWVWLGFQGLRMLMNDTFEGRPLKLTLINAGNSLVTIMAMGLIIGLMKP